MEKIDRSIRKEPGGFIKSHPEHMGIRSGRRVLSGKARILNLFILPADIFPVIVLRKRIPLPGIDCIEGSVDAAVLHRLQKSKGRAAVVAPELDDTGGSPVHHVVVGKSAVPCPWSIPEHSRVIFICLEFWRIISEHI